jgi:hypothetical protein
MVSVLKVTPWPRARQPHRHPRVRRGHPGRRRATADRGHGRQGRHQGGGDYFDKVSKAINFRPLLKNFNSRFLGQKTPYHAEKMIW